MERVPSGGRPGVIPASTDLLQLSQMYDEIKKNEFGGIKLGLGSRKFFDDTVFSRSS